QNRTSLGLTAVTLASARYRSVPAATKYSSSHWCGACGPFVGRAANRTLRSPSTNTSVERPRRSRQGEGGSQRHRRRLAIHNSSSHQALTWFRTETIPQLLAF